MIHKVGTNGAAGSIKKAIDYVLGEKDHNHEIRDKVILLDGDPDLLLSLEKTMTTKNTYIHTSLSFTEEETKMINDNPSLLDDILSSYKEQLAAGLPNADASRLASMTVRHNESDGKMHIHMITLRQDLETGKTYQPFVKQRGDIQRFQNWNVTMQHEYKLENPNSIDHQKTTAWTKNLPKASADVRDGIDSIVQDAIKAREVTNRCELIKFLNQLDNIKVSRQTKTQISIKAKGHKHPICLKGAYYGRDFTNSKNIEAALEQRASINVDESKQRLQTAMSKLAKASHYKYEEKHNDMGVNPISHINNNINERVGLDMVSVSRNDRPVQNRLGWQHMGESIKNGDEQRANMGATGRKEIKTPAHKIFNGVQYDEINNSWAWKGSYGYVHVQATDDGYALQHGSKMEWQMAAQLFKDRGITEAHITCSTEQSMVRALMAHKEAGVKITGIKLDGQELSTEELKERLQDYDTTTKITRNSIAIGRTSEEGSTSSDIKKISSGATTINKLIEQHADNIESSSRKVEQLINGIESNIEQQLEPEEEIEDEFTF